MQTRFQAESAMDDLPELSRLHSIVRWIQDNTAGLTILTPGRRELGGVPGRGVEAEQ